jgi:probable DNA repair protein
VPHASPERELAFARRITARLLGSAPEVVVSHASRDGDRELAPSPLIRHVPEGQPALTAYPPYAETIRASSDTETIDDHAAPPVETEECSGGTRVFRDQAMCPFRAFAELRLGAEPLESPVPGLSIMERGTLIHAALEHIWRKLESHAALCAASEADLDRVVRDGVADALSRLDRRRGDKVPERFAAIEAKRMVGVLREWLEREKQRAPFTVVAFESARQAGAGGVTCKVKVDRIDRLEDGRDVIIDYKTGLPTLRSWEGDRPDDPQLPLYAVTHEGPLAAVVFGQLKAGEIGFKGYAASESIVPGADRRDLPGELDAWRKVLDQLGNDFRAGVADVNPKNASACRRCTLLPLCRFGEAETPSSAFDGEPANA